ncbi:MAG: penicillin-binding protein [Caldisericia bacterium]|nr:penicillin-binding protein [Caldisericia bacterium]
MWIYKNNCRQSLSKKKKSPFQKIFLFFFILFTIAFFVSGFFFYRTYNQFSKELPKSEDIVITREESSSIFDRDGNLLKVLYLTEQRLYVPLKDISKAAQNAVVASEDERFFLHEGVDYRAVFRAVYVNFLSGDMSEGGSTITQQLARNVFLGQEKTLTRKLKEMILSLRIESVYRKSEILEMYLNQCYFGEGCYGIETAARKYFNINASELDISQASILAAVLPSPSTLSIYTSFDQVKARQKLVLQKMVSNGFINQDEADKAYQKKISIFEGTSIKNNDIILENSLEYFIDYVEDLVINQLSADELYKGGLKIYTTISQPVQKACYDAMKQVLLEGESSGILPKDRLDSLHVIQPQGAVIAIDPQTGEILAMVGGRDYINTNYNRCLASRQPGSSFKVFAYTAAIDRGIVAPESRRVSEYINVEGWKPREWSGSFFGPMSIERAVQISSNIVAVKVALETGLNTVIEYAKNMGIKTELLAVPSIALGSVDVRPMDMASAFGTISNEGKQVEPTGIIKIVKSGNVDPIYIHQHNEKQVISPQASWIMTQLLQKPILPGGTASSIKVAGIHMAGKTGTTENYKDGWFVGFTKGLSIAVYVGSDSKEVDLSYIRNYGSEFAGHIFKKVIQTVYGSSFPIKFCNEPWEKPEGIVSVRICNETGLRANSTCPYHVETRINGLYPSYCSKQHVSEEEKAEKEEEKKKEEEQQKEVPDPKKTDKDSTNPNENNNTPSPDPQDPPKEEPPPSPKAPDTSFQNPFISDTGDFSISFSSRILVEQSPVTIEFSVWDPQADSIELYLNGSLVAILNEYPYRYTFVPQMPGENIVQVILRDSSNNILGNKIIPIYVFPK